MKRRRLTKPYWVHRRPESWIQATVREWPRRPIWLVEALVPGLDYYVIAGFETHAEAIEYATNHARRTA